MKYNYAFGDGIVFSKINELISELMDNMSSDDIALTKHSNYSVNDIYTIERFLSDAFDENEFTIIK